MDNCALKRTASGENPCKTSENAPHALGISFASPTPRWSLRPGVRLACDLAAVVSLWLLGPIMFLAGLMALATVAGCATQQRAAETYWQTTVENHSLILPALERYYHADAARNPGETESRLAAIADQRSLDALQIATPEYCLMTIGRHATLLPDLRAYIDADIAFTPGQRLARTGLIDEQQLLDAQYLTDFPPQTPSLTSPGADDHAADQSDPIARSPDAQSIATGSRVHRLTLAGGRQRTGAESTGRYRACAQPDERNHDGLFAPREGCRRRLHALAQAPGQDSAELSQGAQPRANQPRTDRRDQSRLRCGEIGDRCDARPGDAGHHTGPFQSISLSAIGLPFPHPSIATTSPALSRSAAADEAAVSAVASEAPHTKAPEAAHVLPQCLVPSA